jgi:O-acetylserine/cysteine efflux transporter
MDRKHFTPFAALAGAGLLWGLTVPLSKLALAWLGPAWLTVARFTLSAALLALVGRRSLGGALTPRVALAGALGFGGVIMLQNAGVQRTSVSHAAVILGIVPVLVALIATALGQARARRRAWSGSGLAVAGIALMAGTGGGGTTALGDLLVLASAVLSAGFIVSQPQLLRGRAASAVTAVQFASGALIAIPVALASSGAPSAPAGPTQLLVVIALSLAGTLVPFWLFAFGQSRVTADVAGAFVNLEPLVGAAVGWLAFGDAAAPNQLAGVIVVLAGIVVTTMPGNRRGGARSADSVAKARSAGSASDERSVGSAADRADDPGSRQRTPETAVIGRAAVVAHHEVIACRHKDRLRQVAFGHAPARLGVRSVLAHPIANHVSLDNRDPVSGEAHHPLDEDHSRLTRRRLPAWLPGRLPGALLDVGAHQLGRVRRRGRMKRDDLAQPGCDPADPDRHMAATRKRGFHARVGNRVANHAAAGSLAAACAQGHRDEDPAKDGCRTHAHNRDGPGRSRSSARESRRLAA